VSADPKQAVPVLVTALKDKEVPVRIAAAGALEGFGPDAREAVPALQEMAKDTNNGVKNAAMRALRSVRGGKK
jgi:HEAT repeat protein